MGSPCGALSHWCENQRIWNEMPHRKYRLLEVGTFCLSLLMAKALCPRSSVNRLPLPLFLPQTESPGRWDCYTWCLLKPCCPWAHSTREPSGIFKNLYGSLFVTDGNPLRVNRTSRISVLLILDKMVDWHLTSSLTSFWHLLCWRGWKARNYISQPPLQEGPA